MVNGPVMRNEKNDSNNLFLYSKKLSIPGENCLDNLYQTEVPLSVATVRSVQTQLSLSLSASISGVLALIISSGSATSRHELLNLRSWSIRILALIPVFGPSDANPADQKLALLVQRERLVHLALELVRLRMVIEDVRVVLLRLEHSPILLRSILLFI